MQVDFRNTALFKEAEAFYRAARRPGTGLISDAGEVCASPDGRTAVFTGTILDKLEGAPPTRICQVELASGSVRILTFGPHTDRHPKYSPDGLQLAFLSDRHKEGDSQLYLLDLASGAVTSTPSVDGWVEYLHWSQDGTKILLAVAGHGADVAGAHGSGVSKQVRADAPSWMPAVDGGDESYRWRWACVYELTTKRVRQVPKADINIWEVTWCGDSALAAVVSSTPGEGGWYVAELHILDSNTGASRQIYKPRRQLGWPASSPNGKQVAVVEAICSDRWIVAGDLLLFDTVSGASRRIDTQGVDVTHTEWRSDRQLLVAGHRGFETVIGVYDAVSERFTQVWSSVEITSAGRYVAVSGLGSTGDCVLIGENFARAPELAVIREGTYSTVKSLDLGYRDQIGGIGSVEQVAWKASDGLEIQGWLLRPRGEAPHALVMSVHGGPIWQVRPNCLFRNAFLLLLLNHGYAIFLPNPRGSSGRGQDFAGRVVGDMGGADAQDLLSGLDYLVERGIADPGRLGITGGSYGGFMSSWLITQESRFAAAVSVAPINNWVTEHLLSNVPHWPRLFLADPFTDPDGQYRLRSPVMHAHKATAPTLNICGTLDRSAPPEEAMQLHNALLEHGVKSVLVTYPEEGHGIRKFPAVIDYAARVASWFIEHIPPRT